MVFTYQIKTTFVFYKLLAFSLQQIYEILLAFIALGNAEIMEFDICPKNNPYKFKNGQYCCSEPIQKEFDQCDGVEEKCHYNSVITMLIELNNPLIIVFGSSDQVTYIEKCIQACYITYNW